MTSAEVELGACLLWTHLLQSEYVIEFRDTFRFNLVYARIDRESGLRYDTRTTWFL